MKSILQTEKKCFLTGRTTNIDEHHCFYGTSNRRMSEKYGLKVWVWHELHNGDDPGAIHNNPGSGYDLYIKQYAQRAFEEMGHSRSEFITLFGRSFL